MNMVEIKSLLNDLSHEEWWVRDRAIKGLLNYPEEMYMDFIEEALKDHENDIVRNASMEFYIRLGQKASKSLLKLLNEDDHEIRIFAANLLGEIRDKAAVKPLIERLQDEDINVRMAAAEALGKIGDPLAVSALSGAIDDEPWVAMAAIRSLGEIGGDDALNALYRALEIREYRGITFEAIERSGDEKAIAFLTPFVDRDELRELAIKAIVNIADKKGIRIEPEYFIGILPVLIELQGSPHSEIREVSLKALSWMRDVKAIPYLLKAMEREELQDYAISGILNIGKKAIPEIMAALRDRDKPYRNILIRIMILFGEELALLQFHDDDDPEVRAEVALALGNVHTDESVNILSKLMNDEEEEVRLAAMKSLDKLMGMAAQKNK